MRSSTATLRLRIGRQTFVVATLAAASRRYAEERDRSRLGASHFPEGALVTADGEVLRVSYNGRIWRGEWPEAELVRDPAVVGEDSSG